MKLALALVLLAAVAALLWLLLRRALPYPEGIGDLPPADDLDWLAEFEGRQ